MHLSFPAFWLLPHGCTGWYFRTVITNTVPQSFSPLPHMLPSSTRYFGKFWSWPFNNFFPLLECSQALHIFIEGLSHHFSEQGAYFHPYRVFQNMKERKGHSPADNVITYLWFPLCLGSHQTNIALFMALSNYKKAATGFKAESFSFSIKELPTDVSQKNQLKCIVPLTKYWAERMVILTREPFHFSYTRKNRISFSLLAFWIMLTHHSVVHLPFYKMGKRTVPEVFAWKSNSTGWKCLCSYTLQVIVNECGSTAQWKTD